MSSLNPTIDDAQIASLLAYVDTMVWRSHRTRATTIDGRIAYIRRGAPMNPVGAANRKTGTAGTYRPVGPSCPPTCPYLGQGCYGQGGHCNRAQRRASTDPLLSALAAVAASLATHGAPIRLHVTGDFWLRAESRVHVEYIDALCIGLEALRSYDGNRPQIVAWTYTACDLAPERLADLQFAGVSVRRLGVQAVVHPDAPAGAFQCPTQTGRVANCATCRLCWTTTKPVNFWPHGRLAQLEKPCTP